MLYIVPKLNVNDYSVTQWHKSTIKHLHLDWEFSTLTQGKAIDIINDKSYSSLPETFLLLGPQHKHQQIAKNAITRLDLCIPTERFMEYCEKIKHGLYDELSSITKPIIITPNITTYNDIINRLRYIENIQYLDYEVGRSISYSIVVYLLGIHIENRTYLENQIAPEWFNEFIKKLNDPSVFSNKIEKIIKDTGYSHSYFLAIFKKYSGKTLINYITDIRMSYAEKLLTYTDMSIIDIANSIGYTNHPFFTQKFKNFFHVLPSEYRNHLKHNT